MTSPQTLLQQLTHNNVDINEISAGFKAEWLEHPGWKTRNSAVKLTGLLKLTEFKDKIRSMLMDRTPAPLIDRILGGDFVQVGFIRRNAAAALREIGAEDAETAEALRIGFTDPYWEVRTESLKTYSRLFSKQEPLNLFSDAKKLLWDNKFEVVVEAVHIVAKLEESPDIVSDLRKIYDHPNSLVRIAIIEALKQLHSRGIIDDPEIINREIRDIFVPGKYHK